MAWPHVAGAASRQRRRGQPHHASRHRDRHAGRTAKRQYRAGRRPDAGRQRPRDRAVAVQAQPHPRNRRAVQHRHRRSGRHPPDAARGGGRGRPAVSAVAGGARLLPARRQSLVQCRRHRRAGLRQCARTVPRRRGRAAHRRGVRRPAQAQEGQHRLRPEEPVRRRGGDARRHHRRRDEAVPKAEGPGGGVRRAAIAPGRARAVFAGDGPGGRGADRLRADRRAPL